MTLAPLPIHAVLTELLANLRERSSAVLIAPPGAGKTTAVAPALLDERWCTGTVILLSPRRVAARAAAERMAELLGERAGETVGYLTRLDSKRSAKTRVLVMTEAIFVSTILADPELAGVSAVLFDEAHERHLDSDLGLALASESQAVLRPDLRLLAMSATIDGARFAALLGPEENGAPVVESEGRAHPLELRWLGANPELRVDEAMASAVVRAWREEEGDILAFLPGVREIERTAERLAERLSEALILPLHGQVEPAGQRAAIRRHERRRIVLATNIAETSLTLDGVSVVVDSGLTRRAEFDVAAGHSRLVTRPASRASADQRAGRAARQGPGVAYRLWEAAAHSGRAAYDPPEIATADLAPLALALAQWGAADPRQLRWLDPPPAAAFNAAQDRLRALDALDDAGRITSHGRLLAWLPMEPALAHMLLWAAERGAAGDAAELALLLQERGLGGRGEDLETRMTRWRGDRSPRAQASRTLAARWATSARGLRRAQPERNLRAKQTSAQPELVEGHAPSLGILLAVAHPGNLARRRSASGEDWLSVSGRGFRLDPASPLARAEWLAIGDAHGEARGARILAAAALESADIERWLGERIERRADLRWNAAEQRVEARLERRLGAIVLASTPDPDPDPAAVAALPRRHADPEALLPASLAARLRFVGMTPGGDWLAPLLEGRRDLDIPPGAVAQAVLGGLTWDERRRLDRLAPREYLSPAGTAHAIDYAAPAGPTVELRVQALFGLDTHPTVGEGVPLLLSLTSPAGRPIQTTADLPGFWRGSWREVVRDMKGRYPRHRWPDQPWLEKPSLKTRNAFQRAEN
ncbi:MAG: ATP-dependent helicase HrpB [Novosphingobium sp.]|nr:ATP-dependent helicase HrpB [Novosphingobium sp.]